MPASQRAAGAELGGTIQACHTPPALLLKRDPVCQQEAPGETQMSSEPRRLLAPAGHRPFALSPVSYGRSLWPAFLRDEGSEHRRLV